MVFRYLVNMLTVSSLDPVFLSDNTSQTSLSRYPVYPWPRYAETVCLQFYCTLGLLQLLYFLDKLNEYGEIILCVTAYVSQLATLTNTATDV